MELSSSEGAPVPSALQALRNAAHTWVLGALGWCRRLDRDSRRATTGALAVSAARTKMLPLAEGTMTAIACTMQFALGVEACKLIETDLLGRVLPAEDAATLSAVMAALKEAEGFFTRGRRAYSGGAVSLKRCISTIGLEQLRKREPKSRPRQERTATLHRVKPVAWGKKKRGWHQGDIADMSTPSTEMHLINHRDIGETRHGPLEVASIFVLRRSSTKRSARRWRRRRELAQTNATLKGSTLEST